MGRLKEFTELVYRLTGEKYVQRTPFRLPATFSANRTISFNIWTEPEYTKETITAEQLSKLTNRWRKPKIYNPKTNRMIAIDGPTYNKLIRDGYVHWEEEELLIPPSPFENYINEASTDTK
ncbi:19823_t:CDS:2 [Entrophospora sp. SA101]|nr:19823_t:CDS:2 [Entrophospora sp. SA101]